MRIGHMIGPPFLKLSIRKLELKIPGFGVGGADTVGLAAAGGAVVVVAPGAPGAGDSNVTGTDAPGLAKGCVPGAGGFSAGFAGMAGLAVVGNVDAGLPSA
jgi:hypothetical protein